MSNERSRVSTGQIVALVFAVLLVIPLIDYIVTDRIGLEGNAGRAAVGGVIGLCFHAIDTRFNGPYTGPFHLKRILEAAAATIILFVFLNFISRLFN